QGHQGDRGGGQHHDGRQSMAGDVDGAEPGTDHGQRDGRTGRDSEGQRRCPGRRYQRGRPPGWTQPSPALRATPADERQPSSTVLARVRGGVRARDNEPVDRDRQQGTEHAAGYDGGERYSHSIVPGGLLVTSSTTRFTSGTSLVIRVEMRAMRSCG